MAHAVNEKNAQGSAVGTGSGEGGIEPFKIVHDFPDGKDCAAAEQEGCTQEREAEELDVSAGRAQRHPRASTGSSRLAKSVHRGKAPLGTAAQTGTKRTPFERVLAVGRAAAKEKTGAGTVRTSRTTEGNFSGFSGNLL
jgi:hypothetical protein